MAEEKNFCIRYVPSDCQPSGSTPPSTLVSICVRYDATVSNLEVIVQEGLNMMYGMKIRHPESFTTVPKKYFQIELLHGATFSRL